MDKSNSSSANKLTVRLELVNKPGVFAQVVKVIAEEDANLGAVDIVEVTSPGSSATSLLMSPMTPTASGS